ncbi:MAG: hypothetical protein WAU33_05550 [Candidatus Binataceae bacterium]
MPDFSCDYSQAGKPFGHFWEHTVGSGHAPLTLRADWQAQLLLSHKELGFEHVRFHALLSEEMETLICEEDKLIDSFFITDQIMDFLLSIGIRPFVEFSFMPKALASGSTTAFRYQANVTPPKDYRQWAMLINKLAAHWVERYGVTEVRQWFFEVWNEPNLKAFWTGSQQDYFTLYRVTAEAVKNIDSLIKVGGPATAKNEWIPEFLDFCRTNKVPVDFVTTHHYPTDAFGKIGANTEEQLEHAPRYIMRKDTAKVRDQSRGLPVYYTEWNVSSNPRDPLHDESFTVRSTRPCRAIFHSAVAFSFADQVGLETHSGRPLQRHRDKRGRFFNCIAASAGLLSCDQLRSAARERLLAEVAAFGVHLHRKSKEFARLGGGVRVGLDLGTRYLSDRARELPCDPAKLRA